MLCENIRNLYGHQYLFKKNIEERKNITIEMNYGKKKNVSERKLF